MNRFVCGRNLEETEKVGIERVGEIYVKEREGERKRDGEIYFIERKRQ